MSPLINANFLAFKKAIASNKLEHFCIVKNPTTGEVYTSGSDELVSQFLTDKRRSDSIESGDWLPEKNLKGLPVPF